MTDTNGPTRRLPMFARPCAACGRLVVWDGRNGYRTVVASDAAPWPTGSRHCRGRWWYWLVPLGHDPDPQAGEGGAILVGLALAAVIVAVSLAILVVAT